MEPSKIQKIHNSEMYGIFVELGLGSPVAHKLCEIEGASKTVFYSENPYSQDVSRNLYNISSRRLVSLDAVYEILNSNRLSKFQSENPKINTIVVSSFQIGNYNDKITHGYVGIKYFENIDYYHFTLRNPSDRVHNIDYIGEIIISLLLDEVQGIKRNYYDLDGTWNVKKLPNFDRLIKSIHPVKQNQPTFAYIKNNQIFRLEDFLREKESENGLIIYQGSFNPLSNAHIEIANICKQKYPNYNFAFSISLQTFGKNISNFENVVERINIITRLGYKLLICNQAYFDNLHEYLSSQYIKDNQNKEIIYAMGNDTAKRIKECKYKILSNRKFLIFGRNEEEICKLNPCETMEYDFDISSSDVRKILSLGDIKILQKDDFQMLREILKDMISPGIISDLIENRKLFV